MSDSWMNHFNPKITAIGALLLAESKNKFRDETNYNLAKTKWKMESKIESAKKENDDEEREFEAGANMAVEKIIKDRKNLIKNLESKVKSMEKDANCAEELAKKEAELKKSEENRNNFEQSIKKKSSNILYAFEQCRKNREQLMDAGTSTH